MAALLTWMLTTLRSGHKTRGFALFTIDTGRDLIGGMAHAVTISLTTVIGASQLPATLSTTRTGLGLVTRPVGHLVLTQAGDRNGLYTRGTG